MGIFTSNTYGTAIDIYSPAEQELQVEGGHINFYEAGMVAVSECESVYNKAMKEIGIGELHYMEENGREMIYEAVDIRSMIEKVKAFFKKLIDKVKAIFHAFITKLSSWAVSDKDFAKKYEKEFSRKWNDVKDDFEFKGYKFTLKDPTGDFKSDREVLKKVYTMRGCGDVIKYTVDSNENNLPSKDVNKHLSKLREDKEERLDTLRSEICSNAQTCLSTMTSTISNSLDAKEFSENLFSMFRNGETSKEGIEKKDTLGVAGILEELKTSAKTKKSAEKCTTNVIKAIDASIKVLDDLAKSTLKDKPTGNTTAEKNEEIDFNSAAISVISEVTSDMRNLKEFNVQASSAYIQALADRSRQNKAIMVKVIAGGKKMQRESYDYTNESYSTGSFLDSVVLK